MAATRVDDRRARLAVGGRWLRAERERRNLSVRALARLVGVAGTQISNYELGRYEPDDDRVEDIARALGMDIITVRRGLGLWVPEGLAPRIVTPEEAIRADPTLRPDQRDTALGMLALIRGQPAPPPSASTGDPVTDYNPDAPPQW
jgi:transcriptional regulator with XRE-family HTH domain